MSNLPHNTKITGIEMIPVTSSNISHIGYDKDNHILRVRFKDSGEYDYAGVTHEEVADMAQAPSIGSHFHKHIKGKYQGVRVNAQPLAKLETK